MRLGLFFPRKLWPDGKLEGTPLSLDFFLKIEFDCTKLIGAILFDLLKDTRMPPQEQKDVQLYTEFKIKALSRVESPQSSKTLSIKPNPEGQHLW